MFNISLICWFLLDVFYRKWVAKNARFDSAKVETVQAIASLKPETADEEALQQLSERNSDAKAVLVGC